MKTDYIKARFYLNKVIHANHSKWKAESHTYLGSMNQYGYGGKKDYNKAVFHFKSALDEDPTNARSWYKLGLSYEEAWLGQKSIKIAKECYEKSAKYGNSKAKEKLKFFETRYSDKAMKAASAFDSL